MSGKPSAKEVFGEVVELPADQRAAFLDRACAGDAALRAKVEALLRVYGSAGGFLRSPTQGAGDIGERPGIIVGRYRLLESIGEGGFGVVFMAEQREPVVRRVAIKIIKAGMDTRLVIARFEAERQALAMMDHPNIATVLDAGETESGRPYFVMELVKGEPITTYCNRNALSPRERMDLFVQVCHAVQHAHGKGIIHRDLKPSNVLVTMIDGKPLPKVIDFGVAKAMSGRLTDKTLFTEFRQLIGTPEYMSPEQAAHSGVDVDTRSDVYSLGVLLYEMLTGSPPFDGQRLRSAAWDEMLRIIREEEPPKPSMRLSSVKRATASVAAPREPAQLARFVRGDLDWIVMKCLEKDRARRYETVNGLAMDVQRHLDGGAVLAAPPSVAYRLRKFVRRNRATAGTAGGIALALVLGLGAASYGLVQAGRERDVARSLLNRVEATLDFLREVVTMADPAQARGGNLTLREALDAHARRVDEGALRQQPLVEADVRTWIGETFAALAVYDQAETQYLAAIGILSRVLGPEHRETLRVRTKLMQSYVACSRHESAESIGREVLDAQRRVLGSKHPDTLATLSELSRVLQRAAKYREAEAAAREVIRGREHALGRDHPDTAEAMGYLAHVLVFLNGAAEAVTLCREAVEITQRALGPEHPRTLEAMHFLGLSLNRLDRLEEAESLERRVLAARRRILGADHTDTLRTLSNLGDTLDRAGKRDEAERVEREAFEGLRRTLGPGNAKTIRAQMTLGGIVGRQGRRADAVLILEDAFAHAERELGALNADTLYVLQYLARALHADGRHGEAEVFIRMWMDRVRKVADPDDPRIPAALDILSDVLEAQGR
jgi:tetratricopeptide (TPR) repeat protein